MQTLAIYDIGDNRLRLRVEAVCRNVGMVRAQCSVFHGDCTPSRRERLRTELEALVRAFLAEEKPEDRGRSLVVMIVPVCEADFAASVLITRDGPAPIPSATKPPVLVV